MPSDRVDFAFEGTHFQFRSVSDDDHILRVMQQHGSFYERDVLERIRDRLRASGRSGAAVDAGGFIGTHSVFFARLCGLAPVLTFEANSSTFPILVENIATNGVGDLVTPLNNAVGAAPGWAKIAAGERPNAGATQFAASAEGSDAIALTTVDAEVLRRGFTRVAFMKVDVEGAELDVLQGASRTIARDRPLLCVEVHSAESLRQVLRVLDDACYWIVDCLGYSPTYVLEPTERSNLRRGLVNELWVARAAATHRRSNVWRGLRRTAQWLGAGRWELDAR
jgi:FkbM family methyltransferase